MDPIERERIRQVIRDAIPKNLPLRRRISIAALAALSPWLDELAALRQSADQQQRERFRREMDTCRLPPLE